MNFKTETISVPCPCCGHIRKIPVRIPYQDHIQTFEEILTEKAKDAEEEYRFLKLCKEEENEL